MADDAVPLDRPLDPTATATHPPCLAAGVLVASPTEFGDVIAFAPGDVIAGRYRVVRFLARGGMGEVYEVNDEILREPVALKTLRRDRQHLPDAMERLRREIALARRVTHPNVARVFDAGLDVNRSLLFLTMELLDGESLKARIARDGPFRAEAAFPIVEQLCAGLDAAHAAGIIHLDLKSANVMLSTRAGRPRAVVTDFGIAAAVGEESSGTTSSEDEPIGTPAYMAPEQVKGEPVSFATDIYALGVVLFEMMTASRPFVGETGAATARLRLTNPAPSVRSRNGDVPTVWDRTIARCMAREPSRRFASASAIPAALQRPARLRRGTWVALASALVAGAVGVTIPRLLAPPPLTAVNGRRPVVVVLPLIDEGNGAVGGTLTELMTTELSVGETLAVKGSDEAARMVRDLSLGPGPYDAATRARIHDYTGADFAVGGRARVIGSGENGRVRVALSVTDLATGDTRTETGVEGSMDHVADLLARTTAPIRRLLSRPELSVEEAGLASATLPRSRAAAAAYTQAVRDIDQSQFADAMVHLHEAIAAEPDFALAHYVLSTTCSHMSREKESVDEAERAVALASKLPRDRRLQFEAQRAAVKNDWKEAAEKYGILHGYFPDDIAYGHRYALALTYSGRPEEGLALIPELRRAMMTDVNEARLDILEALIDAQLGRHDARLVAARRAAARADALGVRKLRAEALLQIAEASIRLRDLGSAEDAAHEAFVLYDESADDPLGTASSLLSLGRIQMDRGAADEADETLSRAVEIVRGLGDSYQLGLKLGWRARERMARGRLADATRDGEEATERLTEAHRKDGTVAGLTFLTEVALEAGEVTEAAVKLDQAEAAARDAGAKRLLFEVRLPRAQLLVSRADPTALAFADATVQEARTRGDKSSLTRALLLASKATLAGGDLTAAKQRSDVAVSDARDADSHDALARALTHASRVALAGRDAQRAQALADEAVNQARASGVEDNVAMALAARAESLLGRGRRDEAARAIDEAEGLGAPSERLEVRTRLASARARLGVTGVEPARKLADEAHAKGALDLEKDLREAAALK